MMLTGLNTHPTCEHCYCGEKTVNNKKHKVCCMCGHQTAGLLNFSYRPSYGDPIPPAHPDMPWNQRTVMS